MAGLSFIWTLRYRGWAVCTISDDHGQAEAIASDVTGGPEYLLRAVKSVTQGAATAHAEFEAEPTAFRWFFQAVAPTSRYASPRLPTGTRLTVKTQ